jgi:hypothetical protein
MKLIVNKETGVVLTAVRDDLPEGFTPPEGTILIEKTPAEARRMTWAPPPDTEPTDLESRLLRLEQRLGLRP